MVALIEGSRVERPITQTEASVKNFCVAHLTLENTYQVLEVFQANQERICLGKKLNNIFPVGVKSRKIILKALKDSLNGDIVDTQTSLGPVRVHSWA